MFSAGEETQKLPQPGGWGSLALDNYLFFGEVESLRATSNTK